MDCGLTQDMVLVVEDDTFICDAEKWLLDQAGYRVTAVNDGMSALRVLRGEMHVDLVLLDIGLPDCDGLDLCTTIRKESQIPVVMVTGKTSDEHVLSGFAAGADDYLKKPFGPNELVTRVRTVLRRRCCSQPMARSRDGLTFCTPPNLPAHPSGHSGDQVATACPVGPRAE